MFYKYDIKHLAILKLGGIPGEKPFGSKCMCHWEFGVHILEEINIFVEGFCY